MNERHIHEVLHMLIKTQQTYENKDAFTQHIGDVFGPDVRFHACSSDNMDIDMAYDFLIAKQKIYTNEKNEICLHPSMTMCNDDEHNHDHEHHHHH